MKGRKHSIHITMIISVIALLIVVTGAFSAGLLLFPYISDDAQAASIPQSNTALQPPAQLAVDGTDIIAAFEQTFIDLYQNNLPAVVEIRVTREVDEQFLERFGFGSPDSAPDDESEAIPEDEAPDIPDFFNQAGGSGFIWDTEGHIVTNYHVVADGTAIEVVFADDTRVEAELIGGDPDADLAVIKVNIPQAQLTSVRLGDSDDLQVGQLAVAIGNPFSQEFTMTSGIVSGVGRTIRSGNSPFSIPEVIQTDAPINPGNSGGPLFNRQGEVIGINTQIISRSGANSGVGFAVPVNIAKRVIPRLIEGKAFEYAWLGISGGTLSVEAIAFRDLPKDTRGAQVFGVADDGPADNAGLQGLDDALNSDSEAYRFSGDIITAINGQPITEMDDLIAYLVSETTPDDQITLDVIRSDGTEENIDVTLGTRPIQSR